MLESVVQIYNIPGKLFAVLNQSCGHLTYRQYKYRGNINLYVSYVPDHTLLGFLIILHNICIILHKKSTFWNFIIIALLIWQVLSKRKLILNIWRLVFYLSKRILHLIDRCFSFILLLFFSFYTIDLFSCHA